MIFPHHPDTHGTASMPFSSAICVEFIVKGSLHEPKSPLDLQLTHLRRMPVIARRMKLSLLPAIARALFHLRRDRHRAINDTQNFLTICIKQNYLYNSMQYNLYFNST